MAIINACSKFGSLPRQLERRGLLWSSCGWLNRWSATACTIIMMLWVYFVIWAASAMYCLTWLRSTSRRLKTGLLSLASWSAWYVACRVVDSRYLARDWLHFSANTQGDRPTYFEWGAFPLAVAGWVTDQPEQTYKCHKALLSRHTVPIPYSISSKPSNKASVITSF